MALKVFGSPTRRTFLMAGAFLLGGARDLWAQASGSEPPSSGAQQPAQSPPPQQQDATDTFEKNEIVKAAGDFFGGVSAALAELIEKIFREQGRPNGYITGEEASGAFAVGLRYGKGNLVLKNGGRRRVYWQGPSIGFDVGANASKAFTLAYGIRRTDQIFQRFPGVDGSLYFVAGFSMNYQKSGSITLAPIRTGVGLRAGINVGYLHYSKDSSWVPF